MTRPTTAPTNARGLSLIEMLVVLGILLVLLGLLLPMVLRALRSGERAQSAAQIQAIATALESYHQSFGDYPRLSAADLAGGTKKGSELLLWALIAPAGEALDGADGPGFRKRGTQGPVYGPYLPLDKFKYDTGFTQLQDGFGNPILYIPARPAKPDITANDDFIGPDGNSLYDSRYLSNLTEQRFRYMMGDTNTNGRIDGGESAASTAPYILWAAGPDGEYGPTSLSGTEAAKCDDVTNFR